MARVGTGTYRAAMLALLASAAVLAAREPAMHGAAAAAAFALLSAHYLLTAARPPRLHYRHSPLADQILAACPSLARRFWPTPWCFNGHLQLALMAFREAREPPLA